MKKLCFDSSVCFYSFFQCLKCSFQFNIHCSESYKLAFVATAANIARIIFLPVSGLLSDRLVLVGYFNSTEMIQLDSIQTFFNKQIWTSTVHYNRKWRGLFNWIDQDVFIQLSHVCGGKETTCQDNIEFGWQFSK